MTNFLAYALTKIARPPSLQDLTAFNMPAFDDLRGVVRVNTSKSSLDVQMISSDSTDESAEAQ
eukprot:11550721-Karenia_brevis.AAC.1